MENMEKGGEITVSGWLEKLWWCKSMRTCLKSSLFHPYLERYTRPMLKISLTDSWKPEGAVWKNEEPFCCRPEVGNVKLPSCRVKLTVCSPTLNQFLSHKQPSF